MTTVTFADTGFVVTVKVAVVAPCGTLTVAGTDALVLVDVSVTFRPPEGAGAVIVKVPVNVPPPTTSPFE
jgi:hypothetical protein